MALTETPTGEFGQAAPDFSLKGTDDRLWTLADCRGKNGLVVMFICNHCPYVKAIQERLIEDAKQLLNMGVGVVAINANDPTDYDEDSFENMKLISKLLAYPFPYLVDETQAIAKAYGAVCTPDFFGYDSSLTLRYRGRLDESGRSQPKADFKHELVDAMQQIIETGQAPTIQNPSMGCSIKWRNEE